MSVKPIVSISREMGITEMRIELPRLQAVLKLNPDAVKLRNLDDANQALHREIRRFLIDVGEQLFEEGSAALKRELIHQNKD